MALFVFLRFIFWNTQEKAITTTGLKWRRGLRKKEKATWRGLNSFRFRAVCTVGNVNRSKDLCILYPMTKKAIGLDEYKELTQDQQLNLLHRDGVYVGKRKLNNQTVVLFQLYGFYVEVFYKQYRRQIDHTMATTDVNIVQPYIDQINIKGLQKGNDEAGD